MKIFSKSTFKLFQIEGVMSNSCFWSYGKILFLAEIIAGQRSACVCNCIAQGIFDRAP